MSNVDIVPFCAGHLMGAAWSGTPHASTSTRPEGNLKWTLGQELAGEFAVVGWITPHFAYNALLVPELAVWEYYVDGDDYVRLEYHASGTRFEVTGARNGVAFSGNGSPQAFSMLDNVHLATVLAGDTLLVYVDGDQDISVALEPGFPEGGTFSLGCSSQDDVCINAYIDGWRIWRQVLTATQVARLYANELPVKEGYGSVGLPAFWWTKDGDGAIDAVDGAVSGAAKDNWGVLGGVSGRVAAELKVHVYLPNPAGTPRVVYAGVRGTEEAFSPDDTLWHEYSGTADAGSSSGDAYEAGVTSGSGSDTHDFDSAADEIKRMRGIYQVLGRFRASGAAIDAQPYFQLGTAAQILGDAQRIAATAGMELCDFGELEIGWPDEQGVPAALTVGLLLTETEATVTTLWLDFLQLLPRPLCRVECEEASISITSGDPLVIVGRRAYLLDQSDGSQLYRFYHQGDDLTAEPGKYNYVIFLLGEEDAAYDVTLAATVAVYVRPRWRLAGGEVA